MDILATRFHPSIKMEVIPARLPKICKRCGADLSSNKFAYCRSTKDKLQSWCKDCMRFSVYVSQRLSTLIRISNESITSPNIYRALQRYKLINRAEQIFSLQRLKKSLNNVIVSWWESKNSRLFNRAFWDMLIYSFAILRKDFNLDEINKISDSSKLSSSNRHGFSCFHEDKQKGIDIFSSLIENIKPSLFSMEQTWESKLGPIDIDDFESFLAIYSKHPQGMTLLSFFDNIPMNAKEKIRSILYLPPKNANIRLGGILSAMDKTQQKWRGYIVEGKQATFANLKTWIVRRENVVSNENSQSFLETPIGNMPQHEIEYFLNTWINFTQGKSVSDFVKDCSTTTLTQMTTLVSKQSMHAIKTRIGMLLAFLQREPYSGYIVTRTKVNPLQGNHLWQVKKVEEEIPLKQSLVQNTKYDTKLSEQYVLYKTQYNDRIYEGKIVEFSSNKKCVKIQIDNKVEWRMMNNIIILDTFSPNKS